MATDSEAYFAGAEVRTHEPQDRARIAAGSPLAVVGILLETLRERFREDQNIGVVWRDDLQTTDILIEAGYNRDLKARDYGRAIYVNRLQSTPGAVVVGDRAAVRLHDHKELFTAMMTVSISIDCVSNDKGDSLYIGDIVQHFIMASSTIFNSLYGFHDVGKPVLGQTAPFEHDQTKFATTISFEFQYQVRWTTVKIRPLLQQINVRVLDNATQEDPSGHFVDIARASYGRRWPLDPPAVAYPCAEEDPSMPQQAPPTDFSVPIYPGPRGAPGAPGAGGRVGPQGPQGPSAGGSVPRVADGPISAHRVVRATSDTLVAYCDARTSYHVQTGFGITLNAANGGDAVDVVVVGEITELSWAWIPGSPIFCGNDGVLTQVDDPAWAWIRIVAVAETATKIQVQLRDPIAR